MTFHIGSECVKESLTIHSKNWNEAIISTQYCQIIWKILFVETAMSLRIQVQNVCCVKVVYSFYRFNAIARGRLNIEILNNLY
jgi:hypothetical protein